MRHATRRLCELRQSALTFAFLPYMAAIGATLLWSGNYVIAKATLPWSSPLELAFWRWAAAFIVLLPFGAPGLWALRGQLHKFLLHWMLLAIVGVAGANTCLYYALSQLATVDTLIAASAKPVAIVLLSVLVTGRAFSRRELAGAMLPALGLVIILTQGQLIPPHANSSPTGVWMSANVILFALYSVLLARRPAICGTVASFTATVGLGTMILLPFYAFDVVQRGMLLPSAQTLSSAIYLGAGASALAYALWNWSVTRLGASETAPLLHLVPAAGVLEAVLILGESIRVYHILGTLAIALGLAIFAGTVGRGPVAGVVAPLKFMPRSSGGKPHIAGQRVG